MNKKNIFLILFFALFGWACQDLSSIQPPEELNIEERYGIYVDTTLYATRDTFLTGDYSSTYGSPKLSIGKLHNFESGFLLKFVYLPDSGAIVDSVIIELNGLNSLGNATSDMMVSVYEAEYEWDGNANTESQWHEYTPGNKITDVLFTAQDSARYKIAIEDSAVYNKWFREGDNNKGLFFKAENADYIRELASFDYYYATDYENYIPRIIYRIFRDSVFVTDTLYTGLDVTIFDNNFSAQENLYDQANSEQDLVITSGIPARSLVQFEGLSSIPKNAIIQSASLQIPVKNLSFFTQGAENELFNTNNSQGFYIWSVEEANDDLSYIKLDSAFTSSSYLITMSANDTTITISDITEQVKFGRNYIQTFLNGRTYSNWFYLRYINEGQDLSVMRLKDLTEEPAKLRLQYFTVDRSNF